MAKLMLVEDDNNLREIYEARLQAEGYEIVSARDGEEALVVAKAEKPDLIISDVMMPKISGFEMLDILRNTEGLNKVKVIMLTALGQSDDQQRADKLGADRYLVKSQVTLEDIVRTAHELLGDTPEAENAQEVTATPISEPSQPPPAAASSQAPVDTPTNSIGQSNATEPAGDNITSDVNNGVSNFAAGVPAAPVNAPAPAMPAPPDDIQAANDNLVTEAAEDLAGNSSVPVGSNPSVPATESPQPGVPQPTPSPAPDTPTPSLSDNNVPIAHKKVIQPLTQTPQKSINDLLAEEAEKEATTDSVANPSVNQNPPQSSPQDDIDPHSIAL